MLNADEKIRELNGIIKEQDVRLNNSLINKSININNLNYI